MENILRSIGWWIINIDMLMAAGLTLAAALYVLKWRKLSVYLSLGIASLFIFMVTIPAGFWAFENLENRFPKPSEIPSDVTGAILLGGSFERMASAGRGETAYNLTAGRLIAFIQLARQHPHLKLVFSGGGHPFPFHGSQAISEADLAKKELESMGFDTSAVVFEGSSLNTIENAWKTKEIIRPAKGQKWLLVTSAFHMPRSVGLFKKAGWEVLPYPVDYHTPGHYEAYIPIGLKDNLTAFHYATAEFISMLWNWLFGRSDALYPQ